jgi:hypothetical protein
MRDANLFAIGSLLAVQRAASGLSLLLGQVFDNSIQGNFKGGAGNPTLGGSMMVGNR